MDINGTLEKLGTALSAEKEDIKKELSGYLTYLLLNDFSSLVQILYRVDVSEEKLKAVLKENKEADAGDLLTELIVQRQQQKAVVRQAVDPNKESLADEESW
jgi:hypothetical protein